MVFAKISFVTFRILLLGYFLYITIFSYFPRFELINENTFNIQTEVGQLMDYELIKTDIYYLTKDKLITLAHKYNIKVTPGTTVSTLRATCAILRVELRKAQIDNYYEQILTSIIQTGLIHPQILIVYPELIQLKNIFNEVDEQNVQNSLDGQKTLLETITAEKWRHQINERRRLSPSPERFRITLNQLIDTEQATNMERKIKTPLIQPQTFGGLPTENVDTFVDKFILAAKINNWPDELQKQLVQTYLTGVALNYFILFQKRTPEFTLEQLFTELRDRFTSKTHSNELQLLITSKTQQPGEDSLNYITQMEYLCKQWKTDIKDDEIISYILMGINPDLCQYLTNEEYTNLKDLYKGVQKYTKLQFIRQLNSNKTQASTALTSLEPVLTSIDSLRDSIDALKIQTLQNNKQINTCKQHVYKDRLNTQGEFKTCNSGNSNHTGQNKPEYSRTLRKFPTDQNRFTQRNFTRTYTISRNRGGKQGNLLPKFCKFCNRTGHDIQQCFKKRNANNYFNNNITNFRKIHCQICDKTNHTTDKCFKRRPYAYTQTRNPKNL